MVHPTERTREGPRLQKKYPPSTVLHFSLVTFTKELQTMAGICIVMIITGSITALLGIFK